MENVFSYITFHTFHSSGLSHAAAAEPSPHPRQEEQWFLPTGTLLSGIHLMLISVQTSVIQTFLFYSHITEIICPKTIHSILYTLCVCGVRDFTEGNTHQIKLIIIFLGHGQLRKLFEYTTPSVQMCNVHGIGVCHVFLPV